MKRLILICLFFIFIVPEVVRGEDSTLFLTIKTMAGHSEVKNELRLGNWKNGKDGFDPLDVEAMTNGLFDSYFETPKENGNSVYLLWWDIRSLTPSQEWKLQLKAPPRQPVVMEWKQIPYNPGNGTLFYSILDPETGKETRLENGTGTLNFTSPGTQTFIIKSRAQ